MKLAGVKVWHFKFPLSRSQVPKPDIPTPPCPRILSPKPAPRSERMKPSTICPQEAQLCLCQVVPVPLAGIPVSLTARWLVLGTVSCNSYAELCPQISSEVWVHQGTSLSWKTGCQWAQGLTWWQRDLLEGVSSIIQTLGLDTQTRDYEDVLFVSGSNAMAF